MLSLEVYFRMVRILLKKYASRMKTTPATSESHPDTKGLIGL